VACICAGASRDRLLRVLVASLHGDPAEVLEGACQAQLPEAAAAAGPAAGAAEGEGPAEQGHGSRGRRQGGKKAGAAAAPAAAKPAAKKKGKKGGALGLRTLCAVVWVWGGGGHPCRG
jgi:hypothetical protein